MSEKAILGIMAGVLVLVLVVGGIGVYFVKFSLIKKGDVEIAKVNSDIDKAETKSFILVPNLQIKTMDDVKREIEEGNWTKVTASIDKLEKVSKKLLKPCPQCQTSMRELRALAKTKNQATALGVLEKLRAHHEATHPDMSLPTLIKQRQDKAQSLEGRIPNFKGEEKPGEVEVDLEYDAFMNMIERLRRQAGIAIAQMRWVAPKRATGPGAKQVKIPASLHKSDFEIQCVGGFYQLLRFLNLLEMANRHIVVENFQIAAGKSTGMALHTMKVNIFTFAYQGTGPGKAPEKKDEKQPTTNVPVSREMPE